MKKIFIFLLLILTTLLFVSCENILKPNSKSTYVTKFDVKEMASQYLIDFTLQKKRPLLWAREYIFKNESDSSIIFIKVGIHPTVKQVEERATNFLNTISMFMKYGPIMDEKVGDKMWWYSSGFYKPDSVTDILFIRKNAFIFLHSSNIDLTELAKTIDNDIMNEASYITIGDVIFPPVINSISVSKKNLTEGEAATITVNASDPKDEPLEYISNYALSRMDGYSDNVFILIASRDYVGEPFFGSHTIEFWAINQINLFSRSAEITINILQEN